MKRNIFVTFQQEGIHCYPEALTNETLATGDEYDVSFLGHPHRHMFHFRVEVSVSHTNREIEFIQFKRWLQSLYSCQVLQLDYKSCEMMIDDLLEELVESYPLIDYIKIEISEDGENGAVLEVDGSDLLRYRATRYIGKDILQKISDVQIDN